MISSPERLDRLFIGEIDIWQTFPSQHALDKRTTIDLGEIMTNWLGEKMFRKKRRYSRKKEEGSSIWNERQIIDRFARQARGTYGFKLSQERKVPIPPQICVWFYENFAGMEVRKIKSPESRELRWVLAPRRPANNWSRGSNGDLDDRHDERRPAVSGSPASGASLTRLSHHQSVHRNLSTPIPQPLAHIRSHIKKSKINLL